MEVLVRRSNLKGWAKVPSSKSYTHRGLLCATLAKGRSRIFSPLISEDTEATVFVLSKLGVKVIRSRGVWEVEGGNFQKPDDTLYCCESGTTLRMTMPLCTLVEGMCTLRFSAKS
mgnify:CR=1 FL=1